jgi:FMN-dependent NADH-azoreductase
MDYQRPYLEFISRFIGFSDIRTLLVEPTMTSGPVVAEGKLHEAIAEAREAGRDFKIEGFREAA